MRRIIKRELINDLKITIEGKNDKVVLTAYKVTYANGDYDYKINKSVIKKRKIKRGKFLRTLVRTPITKRHTHGDRV